MKISSKKDKPYSSWSGSGIATRDARHDKPVDEYPRKRGPGRPDKNWCGGKEGREHKPEWCISLRHWYLQDKTRTVADYVCKRCNRVLATDRSGKEAKKLRNRGKTIGR